MFDIYELFESVGIIIDARLRELKLDKTILATIIDDSQAQSGIYTVSYEQGPFSANSANFDYKVGDQVYVGIVEGDYSNAYIISKKVLTENTKEKINLYHDLIPGLNYTVGPDKDIPYEQNIIYNNLNKFKNLGLKLKVKTEFSSEEAINDFGYRIHIKEVEQINGASISFLHTLDFNLKNLLKPNAVSTEGAHIEVSSLFDIADITNMASYYIEEYGMSDKVETQDIVLTFGNLKSDYTREGLVLYTDNEATYNYNTANNSRNIYFQLVYKDGEELAVLTSLSKNKPDNIYMTWSSDYQSGETSEDNYSYYIINNFDAYKSETRVYLKIEYNNPELEDNEIYESNIVFKNIEENRKFFNTNGQVKLTAKKTSHTNIFNPDGTIVDFELRTNPKDYQLNFENEPINIDKRIQILDVCGNKDSELKFYIQFMIPKLNCNLGLSYQNYTLVDKNNYSSYSIDVSEIEKYNIYIAEYNPDTVKYPQYIIDEFYKPYEKNNYILCRLRAYSTKSGADVEVAEYQLDIEFKQIDKAATDYVLFLNITDSEGKQTRAIKMEKGSVLNVSAKLYDYLGNEVPLQDSIAWSWLGRENETDPEITIKQVGDTGCILTSNIEYSSSKNYSYILQGVYQLKDNNGKAVKRITCHCPIGINASKVEVSSEESYYAFDNLSGPTIITYNSAGVEPAYYSGSYKFYQIQTDNGTSATYIKMPPDTDYNWIIDYPGKGEEKANDSFYPQIKTDDNYEHQLIAPNLYIADCSYGAVLKILNDEKEPVWLQPIYSHITTSFSSYVNDWDGKLNIDESNNSIMAARLGAGKKNEDDNTFSGVLIGDWGPKTEDGSIKESITGIYGFSHGKQSYGFKEDGTAFIGIAGEGDKKEGSGRIEFDGTKGIIKSGNFNGTIIEKTDENNITTIDVNYIDSNGQEIEGQGTYIDLQHGTIIANDGIFRGKIQATRLDLINTKIPTSDIEGLDDALGELTDSAERQALKVLYNYEHIGYNEEGESITAKTTRVYDSQGNLISKTYDIPGTDYIYTNVGRGSQDDTYTMISKEGLLTANNAIIHGTIYANQGQIAGWNITDDEAGLYKKTSENTYTGMTTAGKATDSTLSSAPRFYAGAKSNAIKTEGDAKFLVLEDGTLYATAAVIHGTVYANQGQIGGWTIEDDSLYNSNPYSYTGMANKQLTSSSGLNFTLSEDGKYYILTGLGDCYEDECIIIPSHHQSLPVKEIGQHAFLKRQTSSTVDDAVDRNTKLKTIIMPNTITALATHVCTGCSALQRIKLSEQITKIPGWTFCYCSSLQNIRISNSIKEIGTNAFFDCKALDSVIIPKSVTQMGIAVFANSSVTIYCEASGVPEDGGWDTGWKNYHQGPVYWDYESLENNYPSIAYQGLSSTPCFYAGSNSKLPINCQDANFLVLEDGSLYATAAVIQGEIKADEGQIGNFVIGQGGELKSYYSTNSERLACILTKNKLEFFESESTIALGSGSSTQLVIRPGYDSENTAAIISQKKLRLTGKEYGRQYYIQLGKEVGTTEVVTYKCSITRVETLNWDDSSTEFYDKTIRIYFKLDDTMEAPSGGISFAFPNWKSVWYGKTWFAGKNDWRDHKFGSDYDLAGWPIPVIKGGETETYVDVSLSDFCDDASLLKDDDFGIQFQNLDTSEYTYSNIIKFQTDKADWVWRNNATSAQVGKTERSEGVTDGRGIEIQGDLFPLTSNDYQLGLSSRPWSALHAIQTTAAQITQEAAAISNSSEKKKNSILPLSSTYEKIFDQLQPVSYKFNNGTSNRIHTGFIAEEVKQSIENVGLTTQDFAAYCEWEKEDGTIDCGLRYEEFVALNTNEIQKLKKRVAELENQLQREKGENNDE